MRLATLSFLLPLVLSGCEILAPVGGSDKSDLTGDTDDTDNNNDGKDNDGDGFKNDADCDDSDDEIYEGADELCDGKDNDCDGEVDNGANDGNDYYTDADGDGYGDGTAKKACEQPENTATRDGDCDDDDRRVNPGEDESCNNKDDDCDGDVDEDATDADMWYVDDDGDGFGVTRGAVEACEQPDDMVDNADDCDDGDEDISPDADEVCNEIDDDCDDRIDEDAAAGTYYYDNDNDNYGDPDSGVESCEQPANTVTNDDDCNDNDNDINPDATEVCDQQDNDCDGSTDEGVPTETYYADDDNDGYGDNNDSVESCEQPVDTVLNNDDCDDTDNQINPDIAEICDDVDQDCDGRADDGIATDTYYADVDGDGYGDANGDVDDCEQPAKTVVNSDDCDDTDNDINPNGDEVCDGKDNDCNGSIDDNASDEDYYFADADADGFGDPDTYDLRCSGADNGEDCDDGDDTEPQVADASATGTADGSLAKPWSSLQDAMDAADMCVVALPGVYEETINFNGNDIVVRGIGGADDTVIDAQGAGAVVTINSGEGAGAELMGFTLANGSGFQDVTTSTNNCGSSTTCTDHYTMICGGGIYVDGSEPTLRNLNIRQNIVETPADSSTSTDFYYYFGFGGGMCVRNTELVVDGLKLEQNAADDGGGIYVESGANLTLQHGTLYANTAQNGAGVLVDGGDFSASNTVFAWNSASNAGGAVQGIDATVSLVNVTIGECEAPAESGGGVNAGGTTSLKLMNSIIYGANAGYGVVIGDDASFTGTYNDVYGNTTDEYLGVTDPSGTLGNISVDPDFVDVTDDGDYTNDNWGVDVGSDCVDAGSSSAAYDDEDGSRNDMGAYGGPEGAGW